MHRPRCSSRVVLTLAAVAIVLGWGCSDGPASTPPIRPGTSVAAREVNIIARDYSFQPSVVDLVPGETVLLHVVNGGLETHEAILGDAAVQAAWESAEAATIGAPPGPTPVVTVPAGLAGLRVVVRSGERVDVVWTVPADGPTSSGFSVGCHIPGHYAKGMVVPVRWIGADGRPLGSGPPPS